MLSIRNGFFSARMAEMATRVGADVATLEVADRAVASLDEIADAIARERPEIVTIVQGETSNTVWNRDLRDIAALAKAAGALVVVDAVCTLSTMPLEMDAWGIDAVITGGQKGLSSIPGVSLIAFSDAAWDRMKQRPEPNAHWCLDMALAENFWHNAGYHYTAPVSGVLALHEALRLVCAETLESRFARHLRCSLALQAGVESMKPSSTRRRTAGSIQWSGSRRRKSSRREWSAAISRSSAGSRFRSRSACRSYGSGRWASSAANTTCSARCMRSAARWST